MKLRTTNFQFPRQRAGYVYYLLSDYYVRLVLLKIRE